MKALLSSLWTDPKVASGILMMVASLIGFVLQSPHGDWQQISHALSTGLVNLAGGGLLWHATIPKSTTTNAEPKA